MRVQVQSKENKVCSIRIVSRSDLENQSLSIRVHPNFHHFFAYESKIEFLFQSMQASFFRKREVPANPKLFDLVWSNTAVNIFGDRMIRKIHPIRRLHFGSIASSSQLS